MGNIGNGYDSILTSKRRTTQTDAPTDSQAQGSQIKVPAGHMVGRLLTILAAIGWTIMLLAIADTLLLNGKLLTEVLAL